MLPLILWIGAAILCAGLTFLCVRYAKDSKYPADNPFFIVGAIGAVTAGIFLFMWTIIWPLSWCLSYNHIHGSMRAFQDSNLQWYLDTIAETEDVQLTEDTQSLFINVAYKDQSAITSERILELRKKVQSYNDALAKYNAWNGSWLDWYFADAPPDLKPIKLELVKQ